MKIRNSFVSNSSTSSFVLVGCSTNGLDFTEDDADKFFNGGYDPVEFDSESELIGIDVLHLSDEDGIEEIKIETLLENIREAKIQLKKFFDSIDKQMPEIKLYGGVRASWRLEPDL